MAFTPNQLLLLNRSVARLQDEQIAKLYLRLYPYIMQDFRHKDDCRLNHLALNASIMTHTHILAGVTVNPGSPLVGTTVPGAIVPPITTMPSEVVATGLITAGINADPNAPADVPLPYKSRRPIGILTDSGDPLTTALAEKPFSLTG